jgi:DNA processing protein
VSGVDLTDAAVRRLLAAVRDDGEAAVDVLARAVWSVLTEPGDAVAGRLIGTWGAAAALERALDGAEAVIGEIDGAVLAAARDRWRPRCATAMPTLAAALDRAARTGTRLVAPGDEAWPQRLDDLGDHVPHLLWVRGRLGPASQAAAVALVGARAATGYGEHVAAELGAETGAAGVTIVSGAAYGIDGAAHRGALAAGAHTVAFLAGGVDRAYPAGHAELLGRIARQGAVVAETPCGTAPSKWRFLARNRLIAAISDATVVVEAGLRSGSLNTAAHAASLGRALGAVPGPVTSPASAGCHRILREFDGVCVTSPADVREMLGIGPLPAATSTGPIAREMTRLLDAASTRSARDEHELARRSGLAVAEVEALVGLAVLEGTMARRADGWLRARTA